MGLFLVLGFMIFILSQVNAARIKKQLNNSTLLSYEKEFKPSFVKIYYVSLIPLFFLLYLSLNQKLEMINTYFELLLGGIILIDVISVLLTNRLFNKNSNAEYLKTLKLAIFGMTLGKLFVVLGLMIYLGSAV